MNRNLRNMLTAAILLVPAVRASAHFAWIVPSSNGATAQLIMSETLTPDDEGVKIDILANAKLSARDVNSKQEKPIELKDKAGNAFTFPLTGDGERVLHGSIDLGINQRGNAPANVLMYYPKTMIGDPFDTKATLGKEIAPIELVPVKDEKGFKIQLLVDGKPAPVGEKLHVILPDNTQETFDLDANGTTDAFQSPGRYGVWGRHFIDSTGTRDGKDYKQIREYATLVFTVGDPKAAATKIASAADATKKANDAKPFAHMPQKAASFGAVVADGYLYLYGGHTADRHNYSTSSVSGQFNRIKLSDPTKIESLAGGPPLQGMNLAALDGNVYRVGGMQPHNAEGEPDDNHSIADVVKFDPSKKEWQKLADLPQARSSHDIAFIGKTLYVVGGWKLNGKDQPSDWIHTMDVLDTSAAMPQWKSVPQPFSRRALIAAVYQDKLYAIGGFDEDDNAHLDVDIFDPATNTWSKGPGIPGDQMNGFSPAACVVDGKLVLSVGTGDVYTLSADGQSWNAIARNTPRIVHRLAPFGSSVLIIGGAMDKKMTDLIETLDLKPATASTDAK